MTNTNRKDKITINVNFDENQQLVEINNDKTNINDQNVLSNIKNLVLDSFLDVMGILPAKESINVEVEFDGDLNQIINTLKSQNPGVNSPAINEIASVLQYGEKGKEASIKSIFKTLSPNDTIGTPYIDAMLELAVEHGNYGENGAITTLKIREPIIERKHNVEININEFDNNFQDALKDFTEIIGFVDNNEVVIKDTEKMMSLVVNKNDVIEDTGNQTILKQNPNIQIQTSTPLTEEQKAATLQAIAPLVKPTDDNARPIESIILNDDEYIPFNTDLSDYQETNLLIDGETLDITQFQSLLLNYILKDKIFLLNWQKKLVFNYYNIN